MGMLQLINCKQLSRTSNCRSRYGPSVTAHCTVWPSQHTSATSGNSSTQVDAATIIEFMTNYSKDDRIPLYANIWRANKIIGLRKVTGQTQYLAEWERVAMYARHVTMYQRRGLRVLMHTSILAFGDDPDDRPHDVASYVTWARFWVNARDFGEQLQSCLKEYS